MFLDLSHGVFVDSAAAGLWREHYLAAPEGLNRQAIATTRRRWREQVERDPAVLRSRMGPQLACRVEGASVMLLAFGETMPLSLDLNTAEEGVLRSIPAITDEEVDRWLRQRARQPFADVEDFIGRVEPARIVLTAPRPGRPDANCRAGVDTCRGSSPCVS